MLKFIHAADFHLDSTFAALTPQQAAARRRESRDLPVRLANYVNQNGIELVLLAGDLFDSADAYRDTAESLSAALGQMAAQVYIAPGNHDWYGPGSPYLTVEWPDNVHIFTQSRIEALEWPEKNLVLHGAAFTAPEQAEGFLTGFTAPADGRLHIGLLHGELDPSETRYDPLRREEIAESGLAYLALGHIHKRTEALTLGRTFCAWPGCPEGRGFDELGEKGFYAGVLEDSGAVSLTFVPFAGRKYEILEVNVAGQDPRAAIEAALPLDTSRDLYRIILTGETGAGGVHPSALQEALAGRFYTLEIRDRTHLAEDLWARAEEDSLRGLFLKDLKARLDAAETDEVRQQITMAARFGLAALDHRDLDS